MQTNKTIAEGSELQQKGMALLSAAHEYWKVYQRECGRGAVVWLENDNGHFVLFTRSEYKESIMAAAYRDTRNEPAMFEPFVNSGINANPDMEYSKDSYRE